MAMDRKLESILTDIESLCGKYAEINAVVDGPIEEIESRRRQLNVAVDRIIKEIETLVKVPASMEQRLKDGLSKIKQCKEKAGIDEAGAKVRSQTSREQLNKKTNRMENDVGRRINATLNINVKIDRNLLNFAPTTESNISIQKSVVTKDIKGSVQKRSSAAEKSTDDAEIIPSPSSENLLAERTTSQVDEDKQNRTEIVWYEENGSNFSSDRITTSSLSNAIKPLRTADPSNAPCLPDEKTQRVWMVDDKEEKGAVSPKFQPNISPRIASHRTQPPPVVVAVDEKRTQSNGKTVQFAPYTYVIPSEQPSSEEDRMNRTGYVVADGAKSRFPCFLFGSIDSSDTSTTNERLDILGDKSNHVIIVSIVLILLVMLPNLCSFACRFLKTLVVTEKTFEGLLWEVWCDIANALCDSYGTACSPYCASGMQLEAWNNDRK